MVHLVTWTLSKIQRWLYIALYALPLFGRAFVSYWDVGVGHSIATQNSALDGSTGASAIFASTDLDRKAESKSLDLLPVAYLIADAHSARLFDWII